MALRPVSDLGLADATDVAERDRPDDQTKARSAVRTGRRRARPSAAKGRVEHPSPPKPVPTPPVRRLAVPLADEPTAFVQFMIAGELQERLADASHLLALEHRKLRHQKTILGALVWSHVDPDDASSLNDLGLSLDRFLETDAAEAPTETKVAAHLPYSLKWSLDGALLKLRRTRRAATAKAMLSALVWRYVDPLQLQNLIPTLEAYQEAVRPRPLPLEEAVSPGQAQAPLGA